MVSYLKCPTEDACGVTQGDKVPCALGTGLNDLEGGTRHSGPPLGSLKPLRLFGRISRPPKRACQLVIRVQLRVAGGIRELSWHAQEESASSDRETLFFHRKTFFFIEGSWARRVSFDLPRYTAFSGHMSICRTSVYLLRFNLFSSQPHTLTFFRSFLKDFF